MPRWVKCLPCKDENLNQSLSTHIKPGTAVCVYNPNSGEAETEGSLGLATLPSLAVLISSRVNERSILKNKVESDLQRYLHCPLFSIHREGRGKAV